MNYNIGDIVEWKAYSRPADRRDLGVIIGKRNHRITVYWFTDKRHMEHSVGTREWTGGKLQGTLITVLT